MTKNGKEALLPEHKIIYRNINDLIAADYNPRKLSKTQGEQLTASLTKFGAVDPAIININPDRKDIIIGGHQRIKIAKKLKWKIFPCIELNIESLEEEKELNVRLNKNTGEFDFDKLANFFDAEKLISYGFSTEELGFDLKKPKGDLQEDEIPPLPKTAKTKPGDIYKLLN